MDHDLDLILTLTGGLTAALVLGFAAQRVRLSPIVGYLVAGVAVGPFTPGFVAHSGLASQLAEIGVILLMFGVGLQFHVKELLAVRKVALPGALAGIAIAVALGALLLTSLGSSLGAGVVFGLTISIASTVVMLRVLSDLDALHTPAGHVAVGWLVVEDVFTVLVLVLLPIVAGPAAGGSASSLAISVAIALAKITGLVVFTLVAGQRFIPVLLGYVAKTRSRDLFTLTVLVLALGIAVGSAKLFGASMALGAFLAGMVVGQSEFASRAASEALPMRDAFAVLFFVSVGMLVDPGQLVANAGLTAATLGIVLLGKPLVAFGVMRLLRYPAQTSVTVSLALAQIGEFTFIVAGVGTQIGILPASATQVLVATAIVSITINPLLVRLAPAIAARLGSRPAAAALEPAPEPDVDGAHRSIVVGYGPVGSTVTRILRENGLDPVVIELNHETVQALTKRGVRAIHGDAAQREILLHAGVKSAGSLVFAASGSSGEAVIRMARDLNPHIRVLARSTYVRESPAIRAAGADLVVAAEAEVALAMAEHVLLFLGATSEQLDRARDRVRRELSPA